MQNVRIVAYERKDSYELVVQVRLAGAGENDWTTIVSRGTKPSKDELKRILDGTYDWLGILKESFPAMDFSYGYYVIKAPRGKRY